MDLKQVILVRQDLKLPKGKMSAQVAHASVECVLKSAQKTVQAWKHQGMPKIVLKVVDLKELMKYKALAEQHGFVTGLIVDAGHTTVEPGTVTCLGIGPDVEKQIDVVTGKLSMM